MKSLSKHLLNTSAVRWLACAMWCVGVLSSGSAVQAAGVDLRNIDMSRSEEGLMLSFNARFDLPKSVEDALLKGLPLQFVVEAKTYRPRWYWRDLRVAHSVRTWRLAYQPLTRRYRVGQGTSSQTVDTLSEALSVVQHQGEWKVADLSALEPGVRHYIELSYRLDTSELPRPLQIGLTGQEEWNLSAESVVVLQN